MAKPKPVVQGGKTAKHTGNRLEKFVEDALIENHYQLVPPDRFEASRYMGQAFYSKQVAICKTIYETQAYCDFALYHPEKYPDGLIIESKWQQQGGSVDEKYPYLLLNIQTRYPHKTILLLDGGGYKPTAEAWLRKEVGNNLIAVMSMVEFQTWVNRGNL